MMIIGTEHNFTGIIRFRVTQVFQTQFANECGKNGIRLKNVFKHDGYMDCDVRFTQRKSFYRVLRGMGGHAEVISQKGLPIVLYRYRFRYGLPVGMLLALLLILFLSGFVWSVELDGANRTDPEEFLSYMARNGIRTHILTSSVDCSDAERIAEKFNENIENATVNLIGCKVYIKISERQIPPEIRDEKKYCNITASKAGEIISADFFAGTAEIKVGDAVTKGQLLAGGINELPDGSVRYLLADAKIVARTMNHYSSFVSDPVKMRCVSGFSEYCLPYFFYYQNERSVQSEKKKTYFTYKGLRLHNSIIPIGFILKRSMLLKEKEIRLTEQEKLLLCFCIYSTGVYRKYPENIVSQRNEKMITENGVAIEGEIVCIEDIGEKVFYELIQENSISEK